MDTKVGKMGSKYLVMLTAVLVVVLAACAAPPQPAAQPTTAPAETTTTSTTEITCKGVTVVIIGPAGGNIEYFAQGAKPWEEATGGKVELNAVPYADLQDKVLTAMSTGTYVADILNIPDGLSGDLMGGGYIEPVTDASKAKMDWDDQFPTYRERQLDWGGVTYGYPWDGDIHFLTYRKDLIEDSKHSEAFKAKYGYDLAMPTTWKQYFDFAEYFTEADWGDGQKHYGFAELPLRKGQGFHGFVSRAVAYAKHPDSPEFFFDPETMDALVSSPGFVRALEDWVAILDYAPPNFLNMGFMENAGAFQSGQVPLNINWSDMGPMTYDPENSVVNGLTAFGPLPGSDQVYNNKTKQWDSPANGNHAAYAAFGGWINVVPKNAMQKDCAMDLATFLGSKDAMNKASLAPGSGVNPARRSAMQDVNSWVKAGFKSEADAKNYLDAISAVLSNDNLVFQLRIPGYSEYQDALEVAVSKALAKQASPKEALDEAAKTWNQITDRIGREKQRKYYRESIGVSTP